MIDTICALSTAPGMGAIAVVRVSGPATFEVLGRVFKKDLTAVDSHTVHYGAIRFEGQLVDEVVCAVFKGPNSFTGEDVVEISCHGSTFIQQRLIQVLVASGCRMAKPGEYTMRAFMNGKMDLSQAEAVADLISSSSSAAHQQALHQMRGGFSREINELREQLIHFASLIELELDFGEEDVEFADRDDLKLLVEKIQFLVKRLIDSFAMGNAIKHGIPVAIVGIPNVGKSTLLNSLLNEERAIVSEIAGTTRDTVEDEVVIEGITFRFIDTAGLRDTSDEIEKMGINRSYEKVRQASVVLYLIDAATENKELIYRIVQSFRMRMDEKRQKLILVVNKIDEHSGKIDAIHKRFESFTNVVFLSAINNENIDKLKSLLMETIGSGSIAGDQTLVTNARHHEALTNAYEALLNVSGGLDNNITGDFLAVDIRRSLHSLGEITGEITTDDLLGNIFSRFCIGK
jgi:tRNA modification GTPase